MLTAASVPFTPVSAGVDEDAVKASLAGLNGRDLADALAEMKAIKVSHRFPDSLVLGCDSTVTAPDGRLIDKTTSREEAATQLRSFAGATHRLSSAAVVALRGQPIWRHVDTAKLTMRDFSDAFLASYLDAEWPAIGGCVGGYRIEGLGAQLFTRIEGSHFTILGLPLLPLLDWLRVRGVIAA
ncbi:Maf family protein [Sphingomonas sp. MMS24-J13]|uniref:Maf family protein n=1 Tax=Sphingomonas sp. MMS24-J13 TaxID=3238686 RepID=UPI00384B503A